MPDLSIQVRGLGKQYRIGRHQPHYRTLRETLTQAATAPYRRIASALRSSGPRSAESPERIWALKDVSFDVHQGEVVGLIGRNGAGKSTLLKILSRITNPTTGFAEIRGRVGSLLEVGTGFHSELTGRENIYLSGAILGMSRAEISRKFDEIVAFAEVDRFIDTPIKHYSSGMHMRLAFAVAAHLEPEVLLIDEVLAVGDAQFQKKCLAKMEDVGHEGRTVLFVSHSMPAVTRLCPRTILLGRGGVLMDGASHKVAATYMNSEVGTSAERTWDDPQTAPGGDVVRLHAVRLRAPNGRLVETIDIREPFGLEMEFDVLEPGHVIIPHFSVHNMEGVEVLSAVETAAEWRGRHRERGRYVTVGWIPGNYLSEGTSVVGAAISTINPHVMHFYATDAVSICVIDSFAGDSARGEYPAQLNGVVRPKLKWDTRFAPATIPDRQRTAMQEPVAGNPR